MMIQFNSDDNIIANEELRKSFSNSITDELKYFSDTITRIEVYLADENSLKSGPNDKKCTLEVRVEGLKPFAVTYRSDTPEQALNGAIDKLKASLESTFGRLRK